MKGKMKGKWYLVCWLDIPQAVVRANFDRQLRVVCDLGFESPVTDIDEACRRAKASLSVLRKVYPAYRVIRLVWDAPFSQDDPEGSESDESVVASIADGPFPPVD